MTATKDKSLEAMNDLLSYLEKAEDKFEASRDDFFGAVQTVIGEGLVQLEGYNTVREWAVERYGLDKWREIYRELRERQRRRNSPPTRRGKKVSEV